jgi:putative sigma-54 modulation protein
MKLQTTAVHFKADQKLLDYIQERLEKLENIFDRIIDARVYLKLENSGQVKDKVVEVKLNVPGDELFVSTKDRSFEAAVYNAVSVLNRSLKKYKSKTAA